MMLIRDDASEFVWTKSLMMMSEAYHFCRQCIQNDDDDEPWPDGSLLSFYH